MLLKNLVINPHLAAGRPHVAVQTLCQTGRASATACRQAAEKTDGASGQANQMRRSLEEDT
jgi:hypothetical protein